MSFIIYKLRCRNCGNEFNTAFGIVGTTLISQPAKRCPKCYSRNLGKDYFRPLLPKFKGAIEAIKGKVLKKYCKKRCACEVTDVFARAVVNFAILYLETKGIVPTTKTQILGGFLGADDVQLLRGIKLALKISRGKRNLRRKEVAAVSYAGEWLKESLQKSLGN